MSNLDSTRPKTPETSVFFFYELEFCKTVAYPWYAVYGNTQPKYDDEDSREQKYAINDSQVGK